MKHTNVFFPMDWREEQEVHREGVIRSIVKVTISGIQEALASEIKNIYIAPLFDITKPIHEQLLGYKWKKYLKVLYKKDRFLTEEKEYILLYDPRLEENAKSKAWGKKELIDISQENWYIMQLYGDTSIKIIPDISKGDTEIMSENKNIPLVDMGLI